MSADSSIRTGTSNPKRGTFAFFPIAHLYLESFGFTKIATHAGRSSGLVVEIGMSFPLDENFIVKNLLFSCLSSSSAWAIAVWHSTHHIVGKSFLYTFPSLNKSMKDFC